MPASCRAMMFALTCCWGAALFAGQPTSEQPAVKRQSPWTTSRLVGSPEPPLPYKVEPAFPGLKFTHPLAITSAPGTGRLFVAEHAGKIYSFPNDPDVDAADLVVDLKQARPGLGAIYGVTFHPGFEQNRFVYVCYVEGSTPDGTRVVRFEMSRTDPPTIDPAGEQVIITWLGGGHNGGCLKFGPDGHLYISTGDGSGASPPDTLRAGQDVSNLLSSILRIDVDHPEEGKAYRVPADNPLVGVEGARPEIWSYGFRNPWKMSFDRETGDLWVGDVGWELWEMIYLVQKGGNYGWSIMEGPQPVHPGDKPGPTPILPPTIEHPHSEAASITGGFVYRGSRLKPLVGAYIYGDYQTGIVWGARLEERGPRVEEETEPDSASPGNASPSPHAHKLAWHKELARTPLQLVAFGEDNAGELYLLDYQQQIYRLVENPEQDNSANFPRKLSETGLFASLGDQTPAPGVAAYSINAPHWADHTQAERWLAVPGAGQVTSDAKGNWQFPDGSVVAKTVSIEMERGVETSRRRLETQVLHREAGSWRPYSYVWNDEQTDAALADAGGFSRTLKIKDAQAAEGVREQKYRFAARTECLLCHNPWVEARTTIFGVQSASLLAVNDAQLSLDRDGAGQLQHMQQIGLLAREPDSVSPGKGDSASPGAPQLVNPYDESAPLSDRAKSYLHVNCAHCHQFNAGGAATIELSHHVKLENARMLDVRPTQGTFGISDARIVAPGDPLGSVLFYRLAKLGGGRMPRVGTHEVDERGIQMIHDWIVQLAPAEPKLKLSADDIAAIETVRSGQAAEARAQAIEGLTSSTRGALALSRLVDEGLPQPVRREVVSLTKDHAAAEVRDLFERFVPASERVQRLGEVVNQAELLALEADAERGKQVFFNNAAAACKSCHRIGEVGETLGPDLSQIGKKYRRDELLLHMLEPSRFMEPQYVPYVLETTEGRVLSGLLEKQTDDEVVLKDAKNKLHRIPANQVELLVRQQKSLMPDLLLRDMTPQEVADLLEYLAGLK